MNQLSIDDVTMLLGRKELQIHLLQRELEAARAEIEKLKAGRPDNHRANPDQLPQA